MRSLAWSNNLIIVATEPGDTTTVQAATATIGPGNPTGDPTGTPMGEMKMVIHVVVRLKLEEKYVNQ